jgi:hypothetical protein
MTSLLTDSLSQTFATAGSVQYHTEPLQKAERHIFGLSPPLPKENVIHKE